MNKWSSYPTLSLKEKKTAQALLIRNAEQSFFFKGKKNKEERWVGREFEKQTEKNECNSKRQSKKEKTRN